MPSISDSVGFAWGTLKKNPWTIIGAGAVAFIVSGLLNGILSGAFPAEGASATPYTMTINFVISLVFGTLTEIGLVTFMLNASREPETTTLHALWNPKPFFYYLIAQILVAITALIGFVLLIVPGVIAALAFMFTPYLIIDKGLAPFEAMKRSARITKGHRWPLLLFICALILVNILGVIALFVGLLITVPLSMLAVARVYRALESATLATT